MRERAQHRCRVNFSLLHRCDSSVFVRSAPMQNQLFAFASVRRLTFRSLSTDAESTFHFCVGATAQFSLAQHRCRVNFSLWCRYPRFRAIANSNPAPKSSTNSPSQKTINPLHTLSTKHEEQGERVCRGLCLSTKHFERGEGVYGCPVSRRRILIVCYLKFYFNIA